MDQISMRQVLEIEELLINILSQIGDGTTYKNAREVSMEWQNICDSHLHHMVAKFSNHLLTLLKKFPDKDWNKAYITANPNIPKKILLQCPNYISYDKCLSNYNMTLKDIEYQIQNSGLFNLDPSENLNITLEFFIGYQYKLNTYYVSQSLAISLDDINNNPNVKWNWRGISWRHDLTWDFIMDNVTEEWSWGHLSHNPCVTWDHIKTNPQYEWNWKGITQNPNITLDIILQNPQYNWNYKVLAANPNITWDIIVDNPQIPWNYGAFSFNPNLTWEIVEQNPHINWEWLYISMNTFGKNNKSLRHIYQK